jgi:ubiquinone/menaquinone biosynthesis C-methylase UbiE
MSSGLVLVALFVSIWLLTFVPAWLLLGKLVALSFSLRSSVYAVKFWLFLVLYLFLIVSPYLVVLGFVGSVSGLWSAVIYGLLALSLVTVVVRIFFAHKVEASLWWVYGFVYDGLRQFYPYQQLVGQAVARLDVHPNEVVLDLGCGTGNASLLIHTHNPQRLYMADNSSSMLRQAHRKLGDKKNIQITRQDAVAYLKNLPASGLDKILLINVVYAVHDRDVLWAELLRVLRPDGVIVSTSSDREGSFVLIQEHIKHASFYTLLHPKLIAVFVIDSLISSFASAGTFHFLSQKEITAEITQAGGRVSNIVRCYGGAERGVNLMMTISKV